MGGGGDMTGAQTLTTTMAATIGETAAVAWVHNAALIAHATHTGMLPPPAGVRDGITQLAATYPQLEALADPAVNPAMGVDIPADTEHAITRLWASAPPLDAGRDERGHALGDLYQALSTESRKGRALCQTPWWVTSLLLDVSYDHAYEQWGTVTRMVDPACGTGHILTEALVRASSHLQSGMCRSSRDDSPRLPWTMPPEEKVAHALGSVAGVDLDPYAAAVARYRMVWLAVGLLRSRRVGDPTGAVRDMPVHVAAADALLGDHPLLSRGQYHSVVANPPYITPKDAGVRDAVRAAWPQVCSGKYALSVPFEALTHELCVPGGYVARLTANSFMKREFGRKLIEEYFPRHVDFTWIIDTSGAYIPGHGTPTCILVSRSQPPTRESVPSVLGNRGEPSVPEDPSRGLVWSAIADAVRGRESADRLSRHLRPEPAPAEPVVLQGPGGQLALPLEAA